MFHHIFQKKPDNKYKVAILLKEHAFDQSRIRSTYVDKFVEGGIALDDVIAFTLQYDDPKKVSAKTVKAYVPKLLPVLKNLETKYLYVADSTYFKALTGEKKAEPHLGYIMNCCHAGYEDIKIVYGINYQQLVFDPAKGPLLAAGIKAIISDDTGTYVPPGDGIIHSEWYPDTAEEIAKALEFLKQFPKLTCDIEAFDLKLEGAGIGTIQFAWDKHNFVAFKVDLQELAARDDDKNYSRRVDNPVRRKLLREFFESYHGAMIYHSATFDVKHLIYNLFMKDPLDRVGLVDGLHVMCRNLHCTKVMAYLATNSCAGNTLGLKFLAQEFAGNWAVDDIVDIRKIPVHELLRYNGVDGLSTFYVAEKMYPIMIADKQIDLYNGLFRASLKLLIHTELVGMPMCPKKIVETKVKLEALQKDYKKIIDDHPMVQQLNQVLQLKEQTKVNSKLKVKQHPLSHFAGTLFNPGSPLQLQELLYGLMGLPVLEVTDTKQPATGTKVIKKLMEHERAKPYKDLMQALRDFSAVSKIISAFIPAFENGQLKADGMRYLHGCFNLGGTVSGRLSSSDPNMQNIPAGSAYGKLIKEMFMAPPGWLFVGADFASLEDRISALLTKDPMKLKVYTDGYDGHCLRAFAYSGDQMPDIVDTVESINSIEKLYPHFRQDSKTPTFLLTYGGTHHGMMRQLGWDKEKSMKVEERYHDLYKVSDEFIADRIERATRDGYVEVAFGLRVRTPLLAKSILNTKSTPYEAAAEGRTAGNAMGQSYGLLNNRAGIDFMERVYASEWRYSIHPVAWIHDAGYYILEQNLSCLKFANDGIVDAMSWQELPEIAHDEVKLGADLDLFYPSWAQACTLPNGASEAELKAICNAHAEKYAA
ncbi:DNA polymerase [Pseudomonas phage 98PfluR60PP]|uniref:DNA polymerase n=1 Tax=Pseudomonas phage 98PfluR60PP TaxID=2163965 RepID=A0A2S1PFW2_9CAUD|nr:DNA polymerase [Pseudomonas phage 98PfluR60PP]AWH15447.1 DNA polymerase [Pseudomonas phage 98PfluR60PP]